DAAETIVQRDGEHLPALRRNRLRERAVGGGGETADGGVGERVRDVVRQRTAAGQRVRRAGDGRDADGRAEADVDLRGVDRRQQREDVVIEQDAGLVRDVEIALPGH